MTLRKKTLRSLPSSMHAPKPGEGVVMINMDEETKQRIANCCAEVMRVCRTKLHNAQEAHAVLTMCRDTLGELCHIAETVFLQNPTEKPQ